MKYLISYTKSERVVQLDIDRLNPSDIYIAKQVQDNYHLWTLADAKDGDVLAFYTEYKGNKMGVMGVTETINTKWLKSLKQRIGG